MRVKNKYFNTYTPYTKFHLSILILILIPGCYPMEPSCVKVLETFKYSTAQYPIEQNLRFQTHYSGIIDAVHACLLTQDLLC